MIVLTLKDQLSCHCFCWIFKRHLFVVAKLTLIPPFFALQAVSNILDNPVEPVNSDTFFDCLDKVTHRSQVSCELDLGHTHFEQHQCSIFVFS